MNSRIIIIEGADNTGKTTLAKYIANRWNALGFPTIYFHFDRTEMLGKAMYDYQYSVHENMLWCAEHLDLNVVLDRSWPSEVVYGTIIGPEDRCVNFNHQKLRDMLERTKTTYILADCDSGAVKHQADTEHSHSLYTPMEYSMIRELYQDWAETMKRSPITTLVNYDMDTQGSTLNQFCVALENL